VTVGDVQRHLAASRVLKYQRVKSMNCERGSSGMQKLYQRHSGEWLQALRRTLSAAGLRPNGLTQRTPA